jgi:cell wall hydrolase
MSDQEVLNQLTDSEVLFLTLVGEARGEPVEGQIAVGSVILNRAKERKLTIKAVCLQPKQFSCWNINDPNRSHLMDLARLFLKGQYGFKGYEQLHWVAHGLIERKLKDNTFGKDHYMTSALFKSDDRPSWAKFPKTDPVVIGNHTFLNV